MRRREKWTTEDEIDFIERNVMKRDNFNEELNFLTRYKNIFKKRERFGDIDKKIVLNYLTTRIILISL